MKARLVIVTLALTLILVSGAFGQSSKASPAAPKLVLTETEHNFGEVKEGVTLSHTFKVKNEGQAELLIKSVVPSCGCVVSDFDKVIPPGQEGKITLAVSTAGYDSALSKTADVTTNDPHRPTFTLSLRAVISKPGAPPGRKVGPFIVGPSNKWAGNIARGTTADALIVIYNDSPQPVNITGVEAGGEAFTVILETLEAGKRYLLKAQNSPSLPVGKHTQLVTLKTDSREFPQLQVHLEATIFPLLSVSPQLLLFENLPVSRPDYTVETLGKFVFIRQVRGATLEIKKLTATLPFLKVEITDSVPGQAYTLKVGFKEKPPKGEHRGVVKIETNNPDTPVLEVQVVVTAQ